VVSDTRKTSYDPTLTVAEQVEGKPSDARAQIRCEAVEYATRDNREWIGADGKVYRLAEAPKYAAWNERDFIGSALRVVLEVDGFPASMNPIYFVSPEVTVMRDKQITVEKDGGKTETVTVRDVAEDPASALRESCEWLVRRTRVREAEIREEKSRR
jgi:hypothetical protein